ncbi:MAG: DUF2585 family protein [Patescibacteria group bacterium]
MNPSTKWYNRIPTWGYVVLTLGVVVLAGVIEYMMGRNALCACGYTLFWQTWGDTSGSSQHISDWYTFSHIIHGFVFYGFFRLISRGKWPVWFCLLLATGVEAGWEILENSSFIIDRYRESTVSLDYNGDSILNSIADILYMFVGFFLARKFPVWVSIALIIFMEVWVGYMIRDNLTLNIIMLISPLDAIRTWQMGG